jgi:hypothetical protein
MTFVDPSESFTLRIAPVDTTMPMRVTLVWTDPPPPPSWPRWRFATTSISRSRRIRGLGSWAM